MFIIKITMYKAKSYLFINQALGFNNVSGKNKNMFQHRIVFAMSLTTVTAVEG